MTDLSQAIPANTNEMPTAPTTETPEPVTAAEQTVATEVASETVTTEETAAAVTEATEAPGLPEVKAESEGNSYEFESTGNEYADKALQQLADAKVDLNAAFDEWIQSGDVNKINTAAIAEKLGDAAAEGIVAGLKAEADKEAAAVQAAHQHIYDAAGGKEAWDAILTWVASGKANLTEEGHAAYNAMIKAGGVQASLAVKELSNMYQQSPGFTQPTNLIKGDALAQAAALEPISRAEYASEYSKIVRAEGEQSPKLQVLDQRRLATMKRV